LQSAKKQRFIKVGKEFEPHLANTEKMHQIIQHLNYTPADAKTGQKIRLIIVPNPDGTPRWICPAAAREAWFLKFYNVSSLKARLSATLVQLIFRLRLQRMVFKTETIYLKPEGTPVVDLRQPNWALFTGTPGPKRKAVLFQQGTEGNFFYKIAPNSEVAQALAREATHTDRWQRYQPQFFKLPQTELLTDAVLRLEDVSAQGVRCHRLSPLHLSALGELYSHTGHTVATERLDAAQETREILATLSDERIPGGLLKKLKQLYPLLPQESIRCAYSHGDFTPWNMFVQTDGLAVYDWEFARESMPVGFDAFHFIVQQGILVERKPWQAIKKDIKEQLSLPLFRYWTRQEDWQYYLKWYLLLNVTRYLQIYSRQPEWHTQVHWLLQTWNEALSDVLQYEENNRNLAVLDIFDFLKQNEYAALKFPDHAPEQLDAYADIDLCVHKNDAKSLIRFLKKHPLVLRKKVQYQSFMATVQLQLNDGRLLHLDLIWKIKRKTLTLLPVQKLIASAVPNRFGIRQASPEDTALYILLFYTLNNQTIPEKYADTQQHLPAPFQRNRTRSELVRQLQSLPINRPLARLKNTLEYTADTLRQLFFTKGMVITFSGVDGAGKSTVINHIRYEIEKKWRKRVVVLRHRPSVLPILSAWTKGRERAEYEAATTLPRQGRNSSKIGSLLRFVYYYADYLLGQFYVYLKYVRRGYILLYDRYYFDFINDSKRSNIELPKSMIQFGYRFLLKPDLNFFLYADAELILRRKEELDKTTIERLTRQYIQLFDQLDGSKNRRYFTIENIELDETINFILQKANTKIA